jgi:branched-chain amino acid transport system permease protein
MTYNDDRWPWRREALGFGAAALLLAALPLAVQDSYSRHILIMIFIYGLVAASWDLSLGYAGIFNFGHLALFGIGLYTYGILTSVGHFEPWVAFLAAGLASTFAAVLVAVPILRLKGIYIVLVTFGFSQLTMTIIISQSWVTGGTLGMVRIPTLPLFGHNLIRDNKLGYYYIALVLLGLGIAGLRVFVRSRLGLSIVALRENEDYAVSRGISLARQRVLTLAASALATGLAGAFYGAYLRTASVDVFGMGMTTLVLSMVLLGGAGTIYGSVLASALLTILAESAANLGPWRPMLIAVLIVAVVLVYPTGLMGFLRSALRRWSGPKRRPADAQTAQPPSSIEHSPS